MPVSIPASPGDAKREDDRRSGVPLAGRWWYIFAAGITLPAWVAHATLPDEIGARVHTVVWLLPAALATQLGGAGPGLVATLIATSAFTLIHFTAAAAKGIGGFAEGGIVLGFGLLVNAVAWMRAGIFPLTAFVPAEDNSKPVATPAGERAAAAAGRERDWEMLQTRRWLEHTQRISAVGGWMVDLKTGRVWSSSEARRIYGISERDDPLTLAAIRILPLPPYRPVLDKALEDLVQGRAPYDLEFEIERRSDRARRSIHSRAEYLADDGVVVGAIHDVTEQNRVEQSLHEKAALLDVAQDAIFVLALDRRITYLNRAAERLYGLKPGEAIGRCFEDVVYGRSPPDVAVVWRKLLDTGELFIERTHTGARGQDIIVQIRGTRVQNEHGQSRAILLVVTDVTEAKRLEAQFLRVQRLDSLGTLASGVAHDLNNVFTPIMIALDSLRQLAPEPQDRAMVQLLDDSLRRGAEIVRQLLVFSRGTNLPPGLVNVTHVVRELRRMVEETFPKNITITMQAPVDLWTVQGDPTQLHQVLLNLCVNARDAMPQGGRLTVVAENVHVDDAFVRAELAGKPGQHVRVRVTDSGSGIAPEILEKIFDPFFTTKPVGQGTGLGLSTVASITRSHGGFVTVHSTIGEGSQFDVYLPAGADATESPGEPGSTAQRAGAGERILVVDDEAAIRLVLERKLQQVGYAVLTAADGRAATTLFRQHAGEIQLVVTDIAMPGQDGIETIHAIRQLAPALPVIAMSGISQHRAVLAQLAPPAIHFLDKPFTADEVLATIQRVLARTSPSAEHAARSRAPAGERTP